MCGATNYPLSMGGPSICPTCDCGIDPKVARLLKENAELATRAELDRQTMNAQAKKLDERDSKIAELTAENAELRADLQKIARLFIALERRGRFAHENISELLAIKDIARKHAATEGGEG